MRLNAKVLKNVNNINSWQHANQAYMSEGQPNTLHIQLVDLDISTSIEAEKSPAFPQHPIRYISSAASLSVSAIFQSIDNDLEFEIAGSQPFANDRSIWKFELSASQIPHSGNIKIKVTEDTVIKTFVVKNAIVVELQEVGGC